MQNPFVKLLISYHSVILIAFLTAPFSSCNLLSDDKAVVTPLAPKDKWKEYFEEVPPMNNPRNGGQPILLPNGSVMIVGGYMDNISLQNSAVFCEIYNPVSKTWTTTNWSFDLKGYGLYNIGTGGVRMNSKFNLFTLPNGKIIIGGGLSAKGIVKGFYELNPNDPNPTNLKFYPINITGDISFIAPSGMGYLDDGSVIAMGGDQLVNVKNGVSKVYKQTSNLSRGTMIPMGGRTFIIYNDYSIWYFDLDLDDRGYYILGLQDWHNQGFLENFGVKTGDSTFMVGSGFSTKAFANAYIQRPPTIIDIHKKLRSGSGKNHIPDKRLCFSDPTIDCFKGATGYIKLKGGRFYLFIDDETRIYDPIANSAVPGYTYDPIEKKHYNVPQYLSFEYGYEGVELPSGDLFVAAIKYDIVDRRHPETTYYIVKKR